MKWSIAAAFSVTMFLACDRISNRGKKEVNKLKGAAGRQIDKLFPTYDPHTPSTSHNKKRFREILNTPVTEDVKNLYTYGDFMGVDYKILMSFTCEASTIDSIISRNNMRLAGDRDDDGLFFAIPVSWWNVDLVEKAHPYKVGKENEYWKYLWYDSTTHQALYEEFSL